MQTRLLCICLILLLSVSMTAHGMTLYYDGEVHEYNHIITLKINGDPLEFDVPPVLIQDRTLVPTRGLFEKLGATVKWKNDTRQVVIVSGETEIVLTIDQATAKVNGNVVMMDVPAKIINDRAMIPVRFISEHLGLSVGWDGTTKTVTVDQICKFTIARVSYNEKNHRVTVTADQPMENVTVSVLNDTRIVLNFPDAKVESGSGKESTGSEVVTEVRWAQYRTIPYIGRVVIETTKKIPYEMTYSEDKRQVYLDMTFEEEESPVVTPTQKPTPPPQVSSDKLNDEAKNLLVVIDPGHGGEDVGAVGRENGKETYEKDINLAIALKANQLLKAAGVKTYMTRTTDVAVDLFERPEIANGMETALFLSVHNNSFSSPSAHGTTVLYYPDGQPDEETPMTSQRFATILQQELVSALGRYDRGITDGAEMVVIRNTIAPSVITEIAFISNPEELALMRTEEFQNKAAQALCRAVIRALNEMTV